MSSNEILEALTEPLNQIVSAVKIAWSKPARTGRRHCRKGHGADRWRCAARDIDRLLQEETGLPVFVADDPLTCVVRSSGRALDKMDKVGTLFTND